jgi:hypothetical protein
MKRWNRYYDIAAEVSIEAVKLARQKVSKKETERRDARVGVLIHAAQVFEQLAKEAEAT